MNKTLTISLGGQLFEIEENAYQQLETYINSLKTYFKKDVDGEEIVDDIEGRIAELFIEQQTDNYKIIIKEQVEYVQLKMGTVKDFEPIEEEEIFATSTTSQKQTKQTPKTGPKKLMRDVEDRVLGGVSSGLGHYFNISPLLFRLLFLVLFFMGPGFIIYVLLWIIVPKATTATDKLLMRGLPVNVNTLADSVKTRTYSNNKLIDFVGQLIAYVAKFAIVVAKLLLIVIGISLLFGLLAAFGGVFFGFIKSGAILNSFSAGSGFVFWFIKLMFLLVLAIPIVFVFVLMVYLLFNRNYFRANYVLPLAGLWLICALCVGLYGKILANDFENENIVKQTTTLQQPEADTLFIVIKENDAELVFNDEIAINTNTFNLVKDGLQIGDVELTLQPSTNNELNLSVEKFAKGKTEKKAAELAISTNYDWQFDDNTLELSNHIIIDKSTKWRQQKVGLFLEIPEGKIVKLTSEADDFLNRVNDKIKGTELYSIDEGGITWKMNADGLDCLDCDYEKVSQNFAGKGNVTEKEMFEAIEIEGVINLTVKQGKHKIIVDNYKRNLKPFEYKRKNGIRVLEISTKRNIDDTPELTIWLPDFKELHIEGASAINIKDFELDKLEVTADGAHSIAIENIEARKLILNTEGAGAYKLTGTVEVFELNSEGINSINAIQLKTENATLDIEGASTGKFWVTENLEAEIGGPASIKYKGDPKVTKDVSMLSSLRQIK